MTTQPVSVEAVTAVLLGDPTSAGDVRSLVPAAAGLYAWWASPDVLPALTGPTHPVNLDLRLLYVGIATKLRSRLASNHLLSCHCGHLPRMIS